MTYQDKTFCAGDGCTRFADCARALTPAVKESAARAGLAIAQFAEPSQLQCHVPEVGAQPIPTHDLTP